MSVMKKLGLDPKHYKHVKSDKHSTTLQHKQGHLVTIAHNVLNPTMRAQLQALSKVGQEHQTESQAQEAQDQKMAHGGDVKGVHPQSRVREEGISPAGASIRKQDKEEAKHRHQEVVKEIKDMPKPKLAMGGDVSKEMNETTVIPDKGYGKIIWIKNEGGEVPHEEPTMDDNLAYNKGGEAISNDPKQQPMSMPNYDEGGEVQAQEDTSEPGEKAGAFFKKMLAENPHVRMADAFLHKEGQVLKSIPGFIKGLTSGEEQQSQPQVQPQQEAPAPAQPEQPQPALAQPQQQPIDQSMNQAQGMLEQGYQQQLQGLQQEAQAKGQLGQQQANQIEENLRAQNNARAAYQDSYNRLENERQGLMHDIQEGHVDPEKFWTGDKDGNGSHSKIMTGLGIILAGFNPTSNPNAALNFLKFQMEQNLNAQAKNLDSKNNLLAHNVQQFGNLRDAMDMTRLQQADILHNQMLMAANRAATPMSKAEMLQKAGQLEMQFAPLRQQFAMRQAMMNLANSQDGNPSNTAAAEHMLNYMRMTNPEMAKEMESRLVPGVGMSKIPIPEKSRDELTNHRKLSDALNDLDAFSRSHTTVVPGTKDYNIGVQKALIVQTMLREGLLNTVYREGEQPLLDKLIKSNPANFLKQFNTLPQIKELRRNNDMQQGALLQQYGLPQHQSQTQENLVKGKDGRMYQRQGNYMVPVK